MDVIRQEARAQRTVIIDAYEKDGTREQREIEPYSTRPGKDAPLLVFFCLKRGAIRSLLTTNIIKAQPTARTFVPKYPVEL